MLKLGGIVGSVKCWKVCSVANTITAFYIINVGTNNVYILSLNIVSPYALSNAYFVYS